MGEPETFEVVIDREKGPDLPTPRHAMGGARLADGRAILVGGNTRGPEDTPTSEACDVGHRSLDEVLIVDPRRLTLIVAPQLNQAREDASVHVHEDGRVVVVGGVIDYG